LRVVVKQRARKLGSAKAKLRRAGRKALTIKLTRKPTAALKVTVAFKPKRDAAQRLTATVRKR
jgi:hypothetical protein